MTAPPRLSIILPTSGRPTLYRAVASAHAQMLPGDELIIPRDDSGDWGATPRNAAMRRAGGDYLVFLDDDDAFAPGGLAAVRSAASESPGRPLVFRVDMGDGHHVWETAGEVEVGNVTTGGIVVPNDPARLGRWSTRYQCDFDFLASTLALYPPGAAVWRGEVLAVTRPPGPMPPPAMPAFDPPAFLPPDPLARMDLRHVRWVRGALAGGQFRRILEVGSFQGYSTSALLAGLAAGEVDRVDICDPAPAPDLDRVIAHYGVGDRVTVHRRGSAELFGRGWGDWDLVVLDGDHREAAVDLETRAMLAAGVRAVFAHDTSADGLYPDCGGPQHLMTAFQAAGYRCLEDHVRRAGERTARGLFFAAAHEADFAAGLAAYRAACA